MKSANPPTRRELTAQIPNGEEIVQFMCQQNMLIELPEGILLERKPYQNIKTEIINFLRSNGSISLQQVRQLFGFSRKYIVPLLSLRWSKIEEIKKIIPSCYNVQLLPFLCTDVVSCCSHNLCNSQHTIYFYVLKPVNMPPFWPTTKRGNSCFCQMGSIISRNS